MRLLNIGIYLNLILGAYFYGNHHYDWVQCSFFMAGILQMFLTEKKLNVLKRELQRVRSQLQ